MATPSFAKILTVLDLFSVARPIINVEDICEELGLSKPTAYRYLKELVSANILRRIGGTSGDYTLGSKIAILDYISRTTDPLVRISIPFMKMIVERTELSCLITYLNHDSCIDLHHELYEPFNVGTYGRGCPRPVYVGSSAKVILAHLPKQKISDYYARFAAQLKQVQFANNEDSFLQQMKQIKKQGYYLSKGELEPSISGLSVPICFSNKETPLALTVIGSNNRFEFINLEKVITILKESAQHIEQGVAALSENSQD